MEPFYPLCVHICDSCFLVQLEEYVAPQDIFSEYAYFSSYSDAWVEHASQYVDAMMGRLSLSPTDRVVELASNDGYLLQFFVSKGIPVLGIEPAANVAKVAEDNGIPTKVAFFDKQLARELREDGTQADLIVANNVLAQVTDLNGFVEGMKILLKPHGVITVEFPHLMRLLEENQFDTIYHEHFSYFSFLTVDRIFAAHGLVIFDVEELWTHGGSLRIFAKHQQDASKPTSESVERLKRREKDSGFEDLEYYRGFSSRVEATKRQLLDFLIQAKQAGKTIVGYGAPGKGNTLLNYCGIRTDFLDYTVDRSPYKQGKLLPGTRIAIHDPSEIARTKPDYVLILPWNLKDEIVDQMSFIREWGAKFVVPIPELTVIG
jgi:2-polyprenyl-3-methyl-5-hydroxy-6-metoxy-1,4-benzoquinol methylase